MSENKTKQGPVIQGKMASQPHVEKRKKTPGSGRKKGGRNLVNRPPVDVKELALQHTEAAIKTLVRLMSRGKSENIRRAAACDLLDRGYGKAVAQIAHTGADNGPIVIADMPVLEQARRLAFIFDKAEREQGKQPGPEITPPQTH